MPAETVTNQRLLHRRVALFSQSGPGRLLLHRPTPQSPWNPSAAGPVLWDEAAEDAALRLCAPGVQPSTMHHLTVLPPTPDFQAFLWIFVSQEKIIPPSWMAVDAEELAALLSRYPDQLAPEISRAWHAGALWLSSQVPK